MIKGEKTENRLFCAGGRGGTLLLMGGGGGV